MSSLVFSWLISVGFVVPMEETNEGRELYVLYFIDHESEEVLAYDKPTKRRSWNGFRLETLNMTKI
ncbi:hypothetical protein OAF64_07715 [Crocinitomicaceae bacterium]|nr:hypothetical protein [Crocinitomicaceae bacterium]